MIDKPWLPAGAIFDMDGLMLDTERPLIPMWLRAGKKWGWDLTAQDIHNIIGINRVSGKKFFCAKFGPAFPYDHIIQDVGGIMREELDKAGINLKPGLLALLDHFDSLKVPLAVATSTGRETAEWKLRLAGIRDRFGVIVCGDEIRNGKPDPEIFLLAAGKLGKEPGGCVGFEDSPAGLRGLKAAGIASVFVKDLLEPPGDILEGVWRRCADLAEAVQLFGPV
jgi:HAD superfamily hydrolase (TIGR01509 family)